MKNIYRYQKTFLLILAAFFAMQMPAQAKDGDELLSLLKESMTEEFAKYSGKELPLYYMNYRVYDMQTTSIDAAMGAIVRSQENTPRRLFTVTSRVGDYSFDNYHITKETQNNRSSQKWLPWGSQFELSAKEDIERSVEEAYDASKEDYNKRKAIVNMSADKNDTVHDFSRESVVSYYDTPYAKKDLKLNIKNWEKQLANVSAIGKSYPEIHNSYAAVQVQPIRKYYVSSEGSDIVENELFVIAYIQIATKDSKGNPVSLFKMWRPETVAQLPTEGEMKGEMEKLITKLMQLKEAPFADPYSGPVLFSNQAAGVFFHEIFGHRVEAHRFKSDTDGQTFKSKLGELVLPKEFSVYMDPTINKYKGQYLFGSYKYDDEGVNGQRVTLVKDGKLNDFLYNRTPVDGRSKSNGHGRADIGNNAVSRQSNLIVETTNLLSAKGIRDAFIDELKAQGKEFGYYVDEVSGGLAMTGRMLPNSFNVFPVITYKVYVDGRPDEMVRGLNIIGTPLSVFSNVIKAGED